MDFTDLADYIRVSKDALDLLKGALSLMPKDAQRDEIERKLVAAEDALRRSDAQLAKELGYQLCKCTFPPQIMLWKQLQSRFACPNPECGRTFDPNPPPPPKPRPRTFKVAG